MNRLTRAQLLPCSKRACAAIFIPGIVILLFLASCNGGAQSTQRMSDVSSTDEVAVQLSVTGPNELEPALVAYVDFDPMLIEVVYNDNASLPHGIGNGAVLAALQPNSILRQNTKYEKLTDAIAARHSLSIESQAYIGGCNFANFRVPDGDNPKLVLELIQREFSANISSAMFCGIASAAYIPNDPSYLASSIANGPQWYLHRINSEEAWDYSQGAAEILVGVVDTGVNLSHQELGGQVLDPNIYWPESNLNVLNDNNIVDDYHGHGTGIATEICAIIDNEITMAGVAPLCKIIPIKIANDTSAATYGNMAEGCLLAAQLGAKVVNLSWVGTASSGALESMVEELASQGVLLAVAAGNKNHSTATVPGKYPGCVSVGATEKSDIATDFTNKGPEIDVAAPGRAMYTGYWTGPGSYYIWWGTSFSAPLVAGGGALLYALNPDMPLEEVRYLLEQTGMPVSGFHSDNTTRRLDLGAAVQLGSIGAVKAPQLSKLVYGNSVRIEPQVGYAVTQLDVLVNGELFERTFEVPFLSLVDIAPYTPGVINVECKAHRYGTTESAFLPVVVDQVSSSAMLQDDFDVTGRAVFPLDVKTYSSTLLANLKRLPLESWTDLQVSRNGTNEWEPVAEGIADSGCMRIGGEAGYGAFETDVLVSRRIDLRDTTAAELTFQTRYNIEALADTDQGTVLVSTDYGRNFSILEQAGLPVVYQGYQSEYAEESYDLAPFLGMQINVVFLFESNGDIAGEQAGEPAGWWVDDVIVSSTFEQELLSLGEPLLAPGTFLGSIPGISELSVSIPEAAYYDHLELWLDYAPVGQVDPYDVITSLLAPRNAHSFAIDVAGQNRVGAMTITGFGPAGNQLEISVPLVVFNHLGDVNADGMVDESDIAAYQGMVGLSLADPGYSPLFDADQDGIITEVDAAAIGYNYGPAN